MKFTDRSISALRPRSERYEVWEDGRTGFGVRVAPSGRKSWTFMFRYGGNARRMTLGTYPQMSLADAGVQLADAKRRLDRGQDPGKVIVEARKAERQAETVAELVNEYLEKYARPRKRSADEDERCLSKDVLPFWGGRKIKSITRRDAIVLIDRVVDRGSPVMANRMLAVIRRMFSFAVDRDMIEFNPILGVKPPTKEKRRDRILSDAETKAFWNGLDQTRMREPLRLALKLLLSTIQRRSEVIEADWSEFDLSQRIWTISAERAKNGVSHTVPLSDLAMELLGRIKAAGGGSRWLFPARRLEDRPIPRVTVNHALAAALDDLGLDNLRPHDLRRTGASHMTALGIPRLVVGKVLNHTDVSVTAVYDRHSYDPEKRRALDAWGARLMEIVSGKPAAENVVIFATAGDSE
jgi:integrase